LNREQVLARNCRYALELADGCVWVFAASEGVRGWLDELARIMELRPAEEKGTHQIYFSGAGDLKASNSAGTIQSEPADKDGWRFYKNGGINRIWRHETIPTVHMDLNEAFVAHPEIKYINMWSALREIHRYALIKADGTPMHAALAAYQGRGVLIAAPGETGKSTCCRRLPGYWQTLCDDQALVLRDRNGGFRAHPFPTWSDHLWRESKNSWTVERTVPLAALFFLEQAAVDEVLPLNEPTQTVLKLFQSAKEIWEPAWARIERKEKAGQLSMLFRNVSQLGRVVPAFRLRATLDGEFWKEMEAVLDRMDG